MLVHVGNAGSSRRLVAGFYVRARLGKIHRIA